jgi:hypothetical protein
MEEEAYADDFVDDDELLGMLLWCKIMDLLRLV